jgi:putative ABC transport system permease protein
MPVSLARRNLLHEPIRLTLSIAAIALALALILILSGFLRGITRQATAYLDQAPGSLVVTQEGVTNFTGTTALLPANAETLVGEQPDVERSVPILAQNIVVELGCRTQSAVLIGYDPDRGGGPWALSAGREPRDDTEIVVDRVMASGEGVGVGDTFSLLGTSMTVSGLSDDTTSWTASLLFVRKTTAESLLNTPGATSLLLVTPREGVDTEALAQRLDELPSLDAMPKATMADNDVALLTDIFNPVLRLMTAIAFVVGTLVVGLVIYTATTERSREYGTLKAVGAPNRMLYRLVTTQALLAAGAGVIFGTGGAFVSAWLIETARPQFMISIEPPAIAWAAAAGLLMALASALFPARALARLAPADAFRR